MTRNRLSLLLAVVAMAVVAIGGFFLAVQPQLAQASAARTQTKSVEQTNDTSRSELDRLRAQAAKLPAMREELDRLSASVPDTADMSAFIDELDAVAATSGMQVSAFTASDATAYAPAAAAAGSASSGGTSTSSGSTTGTASTGTASTPAPTAAATAPAAPTAPSVVTNAAITGEDFSVIPVTVTVDGTFDQALTFVQGVQGGSRLFLISTISSSEKTGDDGTATSSSSWTFGGSVYVLDRSAAAASGASAKG